MERLVERLVDVIYCAPTLRADKARAEPRAAERAAPALTWDTNYIGRATTQNSNDECVPANRGSRSRRRREATVTRVSRASERWRRRDRTRRRWRFWRLCRYRFADGACRAVKMDAADGVISVLRSAEALPAEKLSVVRVRVADDKGGAPPAELGDVDLGISTMTMAMRRSRLGEDGPECVVWSLLWRGWL